MDARPLATAGSLNVDALSGRLGELLKILFLKCWKIAECPLQKQQQQQQNQTQSIALARRESVHPLTIVRPRQRPTTKNFSGQKSL